VLNKSLLVSPSFKSIEALSAMWDQSEHRMLDLSLGPRLLEAESCDFVNKSFRFNTT